MRLQSFVVLSLILFFAKIAGVEFAGAASSVVSIKSISQGAPVVLESGTSLWGLHPSEKTQTTFHFISAFFLVPLFGEAIWKTSSNSIFRASCDFNWPRSRAPPASFSI
ncbi:MAG TPA: hypothetical protein VF412_05875 [Bdellovibrio sp.]|uniref:hypothetical protein n=1 Tax=Bdellovibrio sp. TaxID=28201 RepID=UPI002EF0B96E